MKPRHDTPPRAPAVNRRAVLDPETTQPIVDYAGRAYTGYLARTARQRSFLFHQQLRSTDLVPLDEIAALRPTSPAELVLDTAAIFEQHIDSSAPRREHLAHAALAGASDIMAFLDVSTRLTAESEIVSYDDIPKIAKRSAKTLMELASHSNELDRDLTVALGQYTTRQIRSMSHEELFANLRFDPRFFILEEAATIDYSKRDQMRTTDNGKLDFTPKHREILLGCPYSSRIGRLYSAMTTAAWNAGLIEEIYDEATD